MPRMVLVLKLLGLSYLAYVLYVLLFEYDPSSSSFSPPFILWIIDTINLFIHEAGHFFLKPFGQWIHVFGGSFVQVFLPLLLALLGLRQNYAHAVLPAFWCGESLVNVSVYIRDAPFRQLRLIAKGLIHDWNWLLSDNLDWAETLADVAFGTGVLLCAVAIGAGVVGAIQAYRGSAEGETEHVVPARLEGKKAGR
ncbi:MAG: hypothetical protein H6Q30_1349 [Bacteroidetes bacterium]|nr:hypothetical protein [Bacteroidota bacterium]